MNWRRGFDGVYSVEWMESGVLLNAQKSRGVLHTGEGFSQSCARRKPY